MANNNQYGRTERIFARWLTNYPWIKQNLKKIYQFISWIFHKKAYKFRTDYSFQVIKDCNNESFFGYYDKSPVSCDGKYILFYSTSHSTKKKPDNNNEIFVILQDFNTKNILLKILTNVYNWQQGCRLHWLTEDLFIFNDFNKEQGKYVSCVWSAASLCKVKSFNCPVQDSYKANYFLSINYRRLMSLCPDYGYRNLPELNNEELKNKDDGIWKVDYETGESFLLINLNDICLFKSAINIMNGIHSVNHILISPSGEKFIFIDRYYINKKRFDRLFIADSETGKLKLIADNEMVSHCFWVDDVSIIAFLRNSAGRDAYNLINTDTGCYSMIANERLNSFNDGHPHIFGDWFITDTYPDKSRMQHLILVNWKTGEIREIGEFFHGFKYSGETRCDLHPRFSVDGKSVFFDSVFSGKRYFYKMDLNI